MLVAGVEPKRFTEFTGLSWPDVLRIANRPNKIMDDDSSIAFYDGMMRLFNTRLAEIMLVKVELERREEQSRKRRVARRLQDEQYVRRSKR